MDLPPPRHGMRRWLRVFLALFCFLSALGGWIAWRTWEYQRFVAHLEQVGADYQPPDSQRLVRQASVLEQCQLLYSRISRSIRSDWNPQTLIDFRQPVTLEWLRTHRKSLARCEGLTLAFRVENLNAETLRFLGELPNLEGLVIFPGRGGAAAKWPDAGTFDRLKTLTVHSLDWNTKGDFPISQCPRLQSVNLQNSVINPALVKELAKCPQLERLQVKSPDEAQLRLILEMQPPRAVLVDMSHPTLYGEIHGIHLVFNIPLSAEHAATVMNSISQVPPVSSVILPAP